MSEQTVPPPATGYTLKVDQLVLPEIREMLDSRQFEEVKSLLADLFPQDIAHLVDDLEDPHRGVLFRLLPRDLSVAVFQELSAASQLAVLNSLSDKRVSEILEMMSDDDRVELLEEAPPAAVRKLLTLLPPDQRALAVRALGYPEKSVGRLMTPDFVDLDADMTVEQALARVRKVGLVKETIYTCYITDAAQHLLGVLSLRALVTAEPSARLRDLMNTNVVSVSTTTDQEKAAQMVKHYDLIALPVVDGENRLVGIVTFDDLMEIAEEEATEDIQKIGGVEALQEPYMTASFATLAKKRARWLVVLFFGEMLTASAMGHFEHQITRAVVLALFVPLIISSGGNSGSQAATLVIRAMAVGEVKLRDWWRVIRREALCGLLLGSVLGGIGVLRVTVWQRMFGIYGEHWFLVALTVGLSLIGVVLWGTVSGSMLPFILRRFGIDPATSSAPFVATLVDVTGLVIYFTVAAALLSGTLL
jgi:magnesium transporter